MDTEKTLGYVIFFLGIALILSSLLTAYLVFSGAKEPAKLFNLQKQNTQTTVGGLQIPSMEILPVEYLNQSGNLTFFMMFMFFMSFVGGKISSLGISLMKETKKQTT